MALQQIRMLFLVTTAPAKPTLARAHSGSWGEGHWDNAGMSLTNPLLETMMQKRALMLPQEAAIIGLRAQQYTISGNKLLPGGSATRKVLFPGSIEYNTNIPQDAMGWTATLVGTPNTTHFKTKCVPDEVVTGGEYNGQVIFGNRMSGYGTAVKAAGLGAVVRDLAQPSARVLSILNGVITLDAAALAAVGDYLILRRVKDQLSGKPISGSFRVTAVAGTAYTVTGLPVGATAGPGGFARKDLIKFAAYNFLAFTRVGDGKIGGPFEKYRGRRSKRRV